LDEQGMPDRIGLAPRKGRHQAACDTIGRALDAIAPLFQRSRANSTAPASSQPMFHPRLRGDWRGPPVVLGGGEEMVTRAGAARRYNFWLSGKLPWTQWSEYDVDADGDLVKCVNLTQRREWDERYGIGGHPGWLGWGGLSLREYAQWMREREEPSIFNDIAWRERLERDNLGWPLILTDPFKEADNNKTDTSSVRTGPHHPHPQPSQAVQTPHPLFSDISLSNISYNRGGMPTLQHERGPGVAGTAAETESHRGAEAALNAELQALASLQWLKGPSSEGVGAGAETGGKKKRKSVWTADEDALLISLHRQYGNEWKRIAVLLPGRTNHAAKNRWEKACKCDLRLLSDDVRFAMFVCLCVCVCVSVCVCLCVSLYAYTYRWEKLCKHDPSLLSDDVRFASGCATYIYV
jgi:hypothetical protein